ncbi:DUF3604 domain-containing protein [Phenylobacterium sp.]|uniref:DUF3604 domain-containing protein n=1 Tax=Phenylobacterium sp. TaxID=1871053 RepID=UPI0025E0F451|nr:DUF3604 domain-containing protein [Phenylobacterium sp.]MBX3485488.1 DUF3604 domain-containing protein [Phenylobacterium sp.]MCW5759089.1 DUF3604 domain-containing protein [Phenylobacterium sp.]
MSQHNRAGKGRLIPAVAAASVAALAATGVAVSASTTPKPQATTTAPAATPAAKTAAAAPARLPGWNADRNAYFGDLHVHTYLSNDAYISNVRRTPDDAYRFAKGEAIGHASGYSVRLQGAPLDFTAVTDHSEYLAVISTAGRPGHPLGKLPFSQRLMAADPVEAQKGFEAFVTARREGTLPKEYDDPAVMADGWREVQEAAARNNQPGRFTTFVGYEFTSAPDGKNLHRNVIFKTARVPGAPFTATKVSDPEALWRMMDGWRAKGMEALAISHNSNGSDGLMFDSVRLDGKPIDKAYAEMRARNEPLVEISQTKGTSETHPSLSPNDEWANFEIWERYISVNKMVTKFQGSYVRRALEDGILAREKLGVNPFKLGFVGGTDTHNATPGAVEEWNFSSASGLRDGLPEQRGSVKPKGAAEWPNPGPIQYSARGASGLTGIWAEENSRDALYAALRRKETFATSGPRIKVRFFAGYDFPTNLLTRSDTVRQAYAHGVPMGGDLLPSRGRRPQFLVWAMRDPRSGYLQRAQVVKGWIENGQAKEKVFDVVCADGLKVGPNARCPDNGAGVNLKTCEPDRFKGDVELRTVWQDPEFNPKQRAFYYVRVLENPSCRWSTWDALRNGTEPSPRLQATIMERAWSSPIWYEPAA